MPPVGGKDTYPRAFSPLERGVAGSIVSDNGVATASITGTYFSFVLRRITGGNAGAGPPPTPGEPLIAPTGTPIVVCFALVFVHVLSGKNCLYSAGVHLMFTVLS